MDGMTQQNAALVEQAAAAAQSLQDQASELAHVVSIFKLGEGEQQQRRAPVKPLVLRSVSKPARAPAPVAAAPARPRKVASGTGGDEWESF
jgi:methyl-accepting chemotaxis protein